MSPALNLLDGRGSRYFLVASEGGSSTVSAALLKLAVTYMAERQKRGEIAKVTAVNDLSNLRLFVFAVGEKPPSSLRRRDVERWLEAIGHLSVASRRRRFSTVHNFCRWLVLKGHLKRDPMMGLKPPRQPRSIPRALPADSIERLLEGCPDARARLIVMLMVQQGLRCCEVSRLQVGDVHRMQGYMRVIGKGQHERMLPIMAETANALDDYLAEHPATAGPLVRSYRQPHRPMQPDTISGYVGDWMRWAKLKRAPGDGVSGHALRHSAGTHMLLNGASPRDVQQALGHAHLATTEIYLPYLVEGLEKAMSGRSYRNGQRKVGS